MDLAGKRPARKPTRETTTCGAHMLVFRLQHLYQFTDVNGSTLTFDPHVIELLPALHNAAQRALALARDRKVLLCHSNPCVSGIPLGHLNHL
jgi:hypothetical protein